jgi:hypothetical protein
VLDHGQVAEQAAAYAAAVWPRMPLSERARLSTIARDHAFMILCCWPENPAYAAYAGRPGRPGRGGTAS